MIFHAGYCDPNTWDIARLEKLKTLALISCFFMLFKSLASTSCLFGSQYPARKPNLVYLNLHLNITNCVLQIAFIQYLYISNYINKTFLLLTDVPEMVSVSDKMYYMQYSYPFARLFMAINNIPYYSLANALWFGGGQACN